MNKRNITRETRAIRSTTPNRQIRDDPPRIVIAEDDEEMAALLVRAFKKAGYEVSVCCNGWDLLKMLGIFPAGEAFKNVSLVVSDIRLPGISGLEALKTCGYVGKFPPIILITAFGDQWTHVQARKLGAVDILDKPFDIDELVERVRQLVPPSR
jgi:DNA-binding response OmpR family regulator